MRIGIDISQIVYEGTGVARYVQEMVKSLIEKDHENEYVLFGASLRKRHVFYEYFERVKREKKVTLVVLPIPPTILDFLWNMLHVMPIDWFIGTVDIFWSSDWTQPPLARAKGVTTIHDVSFLHFPESFDAKILAVQRRRLRWVKRECQVMLCDSEATKQDVMKLLHIDPKRLFVVYPGFSI